MADEYPKIVVLVIAHQSPYIDEWVHLWRMRKRPDNVTQFFVYADPELEDDLVVDGDTITVRTEENLIPGILTKTLRAMEFALTLDFDFLLRSNISSFWRWDEYSQVMRDVKANGYRDVLFSRIQKHAGEPDDVFFPSGCGYTCSRDVIESVVRCKEPLMEIASQSYDDVVLGFVMFEYLNVRSLHYEFDHCRTDGDADTVDGFHIRVHSIAGDVRPDDVRRYGRLIERFG